MQTKLEAAFEQRLTDNYYEMVREWEKLPARELIEVSGEILAAQIVRDVLPKVVTEDEIMEFMRLKNPLKSVSAEWAVNNGLEAVHEAEMTSTVQELLNSGSIFEEYELEPDASTPIAPITVREFFECHPNTTFNMITSCGFAYLTPEKVSHVLAGGAINVSPGCSGCAMEILSEELLRQTVAHSKFYKGEWHLLSADLTREQEPTMAGMGMST